MLWVCAGKGVGRIEMVWLLLSKACTKPRPFQLLVLLTGQRAGGTQLAGRRCNWDSWSQLTPRDVPDQMASCWVCKAEGRRKKGRSLEWWHLSSQATVMWDGDLLSWRWLNNYLPLGRGGWVPCFAMLEHRAFALPYRAVFISAHEFCHYYSADSLPHPTCGVSWVAGWDKSRQTNSSVTKSSRME